MDITMGSGNLLLLASLSSYAFAVVDGISIIGNVADPSMVHTETVEIGKVGTTIDPSPAPSASIVERETHVPLLVLEEVTDGGTIGRGAVDPLLPPEGVTGTTGERIISEPTMLTSDLDPPHSKKKTQVRLLLPMLQ